MSMTDPIADLLTRIRNACKARHERLDIPSSNRKVDIVKLLKEEGYVSNFRVVKDGRQGILRVFLRYYEGEPIIIGLKRISTPGRRVYCGKNKIPKIRGGLGTAIIFTSKGVMTDVQARRNGVGGEVVCSVW
ncbi:MAG: 30S ribosomal protein S8 [Desulfuromonadales bacterium C00003093]|nr:MAG: 30S ribosomal protein S8 [Desulfuromonadales bacterium C00003093]